MKRLTIVLFFIVCFYFGAKSNPVDSNHNSNKLIIGISLGSAIPVNNFGSTSTSLVNPNPAAMSGFATNGLHLDVNAKAHLWQIAGFECLIGGNINPFNTTGYNNSILYSETRSSSTQANSYYIGEFLIGPFLYIPIKGNFSFHLVIMGGDFLTALPAITTDFSASSTQSAGVATWSWSAKSTNSFGANFKLGFDVNINKRFIISLDISYSLSYTTFPSGIYTETLQSSPSLSAISSDPTPLWLGLIEPTTSVAYGF